MPSPTANARDLVVLDGYLSAARCDALLDAVAAYRAEHPLPLIERPGTPRALRYRVIDGEQVHAHLPALEDLYREVLAIVREHFGAAVVPLRHRVAGVNVNLVPPGGEYRWHYDRNAVTALLYLNRVDGGETEIYPGYRVSLGRWQASPLQQRLDGVLQWGPVRRVFGRMRSIAPAVGRLVLMRGDRSLHAVRAVTGSDERINLVMTFDVPGARHLQERALDPYLYAASTDTPDFDPNSTPKVPGTGGG